MDEAEANFHLAEAEANFHLAEVEAKNALIFSAKFYILTPFSQTKKKQIFDRTSKFSAQNGL